MRKMRRSKTQNINEVIRAFLKDAGLDKRLKEKELIHAWPEIVGTMIARRTQKIEINKGRMTITLRSSVVKNELMMLRDELKKRLNEKAGEELITEIILK